MEVLARVAGESDLPLTVVMLSASPADVRRVVEVCSPSVTSLLLCAPSLPSPSRTRGVREVRAWGNACKKPSQLMALVRALSVPSVARVALVHLGAPPISPTLRALQLFVALPNACLLLLAPSCPGTSRQGACALPAGALKATFGIARDHRFTLSMLPRGAERHSAWCSLLARAIQKGCNPTGSPADSPGSLEARRSEPACAISAAQLCEEIVASRGSRGRGDAAVVWGDAGCLLVVGWRGPLPSPPAAAQEDEGVMDGPARPVQSVPPPGSTQELFPPVFLSVIDQLEELQEIIFSLVFAEGSSVSSARPDGALPDALSEKERAAGGSLRLVRSTAKRYVEGGYANHHYVPQPPSPYCVALELQLMAGGNGERGGASEGKGVGFIAALPYSDGSSSPHNFFPTAVAWRHFHAAQVERLVLLPGYRGLGLKEWLLSACCDAYHSIGLPVRVKTGSAHVHQSFTACPLLAYEGHRPAGQVCGVFKRRPMKRYARLLPAEGFQESSPPAPEPSSSRQEGREGSLELTPQALPLVNTAGVASTSFNNPLSSASPLTKEAPHPRGAGDTSIHSLLNKITPDSFDRLSCRLVPAACQSAAILRQSLQLLLRRASREPNLSPLYVDLIGRIGASTVQVEDTTPTSPPSVPPEAFSFAMASELRAFLAAASSSSEAASAGRVLAELFCSGVVEVSHESSLSRTAVQAALLQVLVSSLKALLSLKPGEVSPMLLCPLVSGAGWPSIREQAPDFADCIAAALEAAAASSVGHVALRCRDALKEIRSVPDLSQMKDTCAQQGKADRGVQASAAASFPRHKPLRLAELRAEFAREMGIVLVPKDTAPEKLRGLREGWIHWYIGSPLVHPETRKHYCFDQERGQFMRMPQE